MDTLASHWGTVHGIGGLCEMEMRMETEYGDYLAESLKELKKEQFDKKTPARPCNMLWRYHLGASSYTGARLFRR